MSDLSRLRLITSRQNLSVKELRRALQTAELTPDGYCAIEGFRIVEEALRSGLRLKAVFLSESGKQRAEGLLPQLSKHTEAILLPDEVFQSAVVTESPQGAAALVKLPGYRLEEILSNPTKPLPIVAAGVQDPGNLGTMIRSAEAFGASGFLITEKTVSPFNSKVVRASAGSLFRLPLLHMKIEEAIVALRTGGLQLLGATSHKGRALDEVSLTGSVAVFIGSEGGGLSKSVLQAMDDRLEIPHSAQVESLNAGVAASIVLYEAARQRRQPNLNPPG